MSVTVYKPVASHGSDRHIPNNTHHKVNPIFVLRYRNNGMFYYGYVFKTLYTYEFAIFRLGFLKSVFVSTAYSLALCIVRRTRGA